MTLALKIWFALISIGTVLALIGLFANEPLTDYKQFDVYFVYVGISGLIIIVATWFGSIIVEKYYIKHEKKSPFIGDD